MRSLHTNPYQNHGQTGRFPNIQNVLRLRSEGHRTAHIDETKPKMLAADDVKLQILHYHSVFTSELARQSTEALLNQITIFNLFCRFGKLYGHLAINCLSSVVVASRRGNNRRVLDLRLEFELVAGITRQQQIGQSTVGLQLIPTSRVMSQEVREPPTKAARS